MNRRTYLGVFATVVVCVAGLGLASQLDQGAISLGDDAALSETVSGTGESFEFEVVDGADIDVTVTDRGDAPYRGAFALEDPEGTEVLTGGPRSSSVASSTHTAGQEGTYRLVVTPQGTSLGVDVHIDAPSE
jgi:hypothetical protein